MRQWDSERSRRWRRALLYMAVIGHTWFVAVPSGLAMLSPHRRLPRPRSKPAVALGSLSFGMGACLSFWAAHDLIERGHGTPFPLDPTERLVTDGLYGWVRNPQAIAMLLMAGGESLALRIPHTPAYLILTLAYLELAARSVEDWQLSRSFGREYEVYRANVPRWWARRPL